jgi:hypothetical protein
MKIPDGESKKKLLRGVVDIHVHTAPDVRERPLDDHELVRQAAEVGLSAVVIKSHVFSTVERAWLMNRLDPGVQVFGGLVLNRQVGGLNAHAVRAAIAMGAAIIWLPTTWAYNERLKSHGLTDGIRTIDDFGEIVPELREIIAIVAESDVTLATGHISPEESLVVTREARKIGVGKIVITHPEWATIGMSIGEQKKLLEYGVYFERCAKNRPLGSKEYVPILQENVSAIRELGAASTIVSTDAGQSEYLSWLDSLSSYVDFLYSSGFSQDEINVMTKVNPSYILRMETK